MNIVIILYASDVRAFDCSLSVNMYTIIIIFYPQMSIH